MYKVGIIGSGEVVGDAEVMLRIIKYLKRNKPEAIVVLNDNDFSNWIDRFFGNYYEVRKYKLPNPFWIGKCSTVERKNLFRENQINCLKTSVDKVLIVRKDKEGFFSGLSRKLREEGIEVEEVIPF